MCSAAMFQHRDDQLHFHTGQYPELLAHHELSGRLLITCCRPVRDRHSPKRLLTDHFHGLRLDEAPIASVQPSVISYQS